MTRAQHSWNTSVVLRQARGRSALLMLVFAIGLLGTMLHQATAIHARCPEHGELVHASAAAPAGSNARGLAVWASELRDDTSSDDLHGMPTGGGHEHEHCYATCATRAGVVHASQDAVAAAPLIAHAVATIDDSTRAADRALYRTAPKTSPPA